LSRVPCAVACHAFERFARKHAGPNKILPNSPTDVCHAFGVLPRKHVDSMLNMDRVKTESRPMPPAYIIVLMYLEYFFNQKASVS
jgi:hypothetical protein